MATFTFNYTIPGNGVYQSVNVQATITADPVPGNSLGAYLVSNITGTRTVGSTVETITGPDTDPSTDDAASNYFYPENNGNGVANSGYFDLSGLSYFINPPTQSANGGGTNTPDSTTGVVNFFRSYGGSGYNYYGEDDSGVDIVEPTPQQGASFSATCYATGTLIRTARGDIPVELLVVGDLAVTASGAQRPIRWLGHRTVDCRNHPRRVEVQPVRILAGAFGDDLPARDLTLSPGHPILVGANANGQGEGGHLVPIMCLINGTTIERLAVDEVTYWHVELDSHDILLAEGLPAESYLDWGDRAFFSEAEEHALMNPDFVVPGLAGRCRPVAVDGPVVEAERRRLDAVWSARLVEACAWPGPDVLALDRPGSRDLNTPSA